MIQLKLVRLKSPLFGGTNTIRDKEAEIQFIDDRGVVAIKRRVEPYTEYIVALGHIEQMEPLEPLDGVFKAPDVKIVIELPPPVLTAVQQSVVDGTFGVKSTTLEEHKSSDEIRFVKINGVIEQRTGAKKPDEIEALEYAALEAEERKAAVAEASRPKKKLKPGTIAEMLKESKESIEE